MSQRLFQCCKEGEREVEDEGEKCGKMKGGVGEGMTSLSVLTHQLLKHRICVTCFLKPDGKKNLPLCFLSRDLPLRGHDDGPPTGELPGVLG